MPREAKSCNPRSAPCHGRPAFLREVVADGHVLPQITDGAGNLHARLVETHHGATGTPRAGIFQKRRFQPLAGVRKSANTVAGRPYSPRP